MPDTPILLSNGSSLAISQIKPGDTVKAYNEKGELVHSKVNTVLQHEVNHYFVLSTQSSSIKVTGEHPFYVGKGHFRKVETLVVGDAIYLFDKAGLHSEAINGITKINAKTRVFNLKTDDPHTYFAAGIAVHNKGGGCFPAGTKIKTSTGDKPIEQVKPGDLLVSINKNGQELETRVVSTQATRSKLLTLVTNQGTLTTTEEHPLATSTGHFVPAGTLNPKNTILFSSPIGLVSAIIQAKHLLPEQVVYNLSVNSPHTFLADGFLVHNKGGGGGGGGGGHGGRGGGGKSDSFTMLVFLIAYLICFLWDRIKQSMHGLDFNFCNTVITLKAKKTEQLLQFIAVQDKTMDPVELKKRIRMVFMLLQDCWSNRDYKPMESLLMPDLYRQHCMQIAGMIRNHEINRIIGLQIQSIDLVNIRYTEKRDQREFTALVSAKAQDYYIDDQTKAFIRGDTEAEPFQEFWTFQLQESGWLLREIEQTMESNYLKEENFVEQFTDGQIQKIYQDQVDNLGKAGPGLLKEMFAKTSKVERMLNFLVKSDPLWDRQRMTSRVRLVFTDVHLALEAGVLSEQTQAELYPNVAAAFNETISSWKKDGNTIEYRNFCIRKVEILLVKSFDDKSQNEFTARILAHAQRIQLQNGNLISKDQDVTPFEEYWTFGLLDGQWKLKDALPKSQTRKLLGAENTEEGSTADLVKWYYSKKRAL